MSFSKRCIFDDFQGSTHMRRISIKLSIVPYCDHDQNFINFSNYQKEAAGHTFGRPKKVSIACQVKYIAWFMMNVVLRQVLFQ